MKLGIISDAHHYYDLEGTLSTLPLLARQFEQWAAVFDQVIVCAPLLDGPPPSLFDRYRVSNIQLLPVRNAGGNSLSAKIDLLRTTASWWKTIQELFARVDAVHIRCPNNISIPGLLALQSTGLLRQALYTGSWKSHPGEPVSYALQRFYLKHFFKGPVAIYGEWSGQPAHIVPSFSPSYSEADWTQENDQVADRLIKLDSLPHLVLPIRLVTVGALNKNKNQALVIKVVHELRHQGLHCLLDVLGEGEERGNLENLIISLGLENEVFIHGNVPHSMVRQYYRQADYVIQAPFSEGFGKVPLEAMFHGAVPILSEVDISSQLIGGSVRGRCFPQDDLFMVVRIIQDLSCKPGELADLIRNGREYSRNFTLEAWQKHLVSVLEKSWNISFQNIRKWNSL